MVFIHLTGRTPGFFYLFPQAGMANFQILHPFYFCFPPETGICYQGFDIPCFYYAKKSQSMLVMC